MTRSMATSREDNDAMGGALAVVDGGRKEADEDEEGGEEASEVVEGCSGEMFQRFGGADNVGGGRRSGVADVGGGRLMSVSCC